MKKKTTAFFLSFLLLITVPFIPKAEAIVKTSDFKMLVDTVFDFDSVNSFSENLCEVYKTGKPVL